MPDIKAMYETRFLPAQNQTWLASYRAALDRVQSVDETTFRSAAFQQELWEVDGVSGIGPGASVTVPGAYTDDQIINALWSLRNWQAPGDPASKAQYLDSEFNRVLALVSPKHNERRPAARLIRIFAVLRPYDIVVLMDGRRTTQVRQWVERPSLGLGKVGQNAIARQAIREALGPERSLDDAISYSQFAWFIWETISADENEGPGALAAAGTQERATDAPKLVILPARIQRKGMFYVADNLRLLMTVVRAAENGIEREDLLQQIGEEAPNLNRGSRQQVLTQAVSLGMLAIDGAIYRPTRAGTGLLEGESAADMLTPIFVRSIFGFALILADLRDTKSLQRGAIAERARGYYPRWTSEFAPNALVAWLRDLGLVGVQGAGRTAVVALTEAGEYWASGLPGNIKTPDHLLADERPELLDAESETPVAAQDKLGTLQAASIEAVLARFSANPDLGQFVFSNDQIRLVYAALHSVESKRFILLAGLSGTGKTSMARAFAQAYCEVKGLPPAQHYAQISVWPDWTDPTGLLGFVNPLADPPTFHETPALRFILAASREPDKPFFLCLDEMNLARVEHYFAPFLSAMEGRGGLLTIHTGEKVDLIPPVIPWPQNLFIIGTVNMDESTHPFSDKVLDRAFTFEFWHADLKAWREKAAARAPADVLQRVADVLQELYTALAPARRHFAYRTCDEVLGLCSARSGLSLEAALDAAVMAKVLPKVRGESGGALSEALAKAAEICGKERLNQSQSKLVQMQTSLDALGTVRFWS